MMLIELSSSKQMTSTELKNFLDDIKYLIKNWNIDVHIRITAMMQCDLCNKLFTIHEIIDAGWQCPNCGRLKDGTRR